MWNNTINIAKIKTKTKEEKKRRVFRKLKRRKMVEIISPGFRFYPTEEELISFYLHKKLEGKRPELDRVIPVVNIYDLDPWHLPST